MGCTFVRSIKAADAALLVTLPPGAFTVLVSDAAGGAGTGLVEVYESP